MTDPISPLAPGGLQALQEVTLRTYLDSLGNRSVNLSHKCLRGPIREILSEPGREVVKPIRRGEGRHHEIGVLAGEPIPPGTAS